MAATPGYCSHCGHILEDPGQIYIHNVDATFSSNQISCTRCGKVARLVDGTFSERGNGLELISGPPLTRAILERLQELARKAEAQEITPEEVIEQTEAIDPNLAGALRSAPLASVITIFIALVTLYLSYDGNRSSSEFQSQALKILERQAAAVEEIAKSIRNSNDKKSDGAGSKHLSAAKTDKTKEGSRVKKPSKRRRDVNKNRRDALRERRRMFPRHKSRRPSS